MVLEHLSKLKCLSLYRNVCMDAQRKKQLSVGDGAYLLSSWRVPRAMHLHHHAMPDNPTSIGALYSAIYMPSC
jgi:hypothetical protein